MESELENIQRTQDASQYWPLIQWVLCLQSGFASTEEGNKIFYYTQWAKIKLMNKVAKKFGLNLNSRFSVKESFE